MKLLCFTLFSIAVFASSCHKIKQDEPGWLNAVVEDTQDMNCGLPRLSFYEDSVKVREITGEKFHVNFVSKGLPVEYNRRGKKLKVLVENLKPEEFFACLTWGPNFPSVKIIDARER